MLAEGIGAVVISLSTISSHLHCVHALVDDTSVRLSHFLSVIVWSFKPVA